MGWGTFIASRMINAIKVRDTAWENEKFERSIAQREDEAHKLRIEFVRYALEDTVLGHPKIRATISVDEWIALSMKLSEKVFNLTTQIIYCGFSMVLAGISILPWVSGGNSGDTGTALKVFFYFFFVWLLSYFMIEHIYIKRCFGSWINKNFQSKGWNTKELLKEVRVTSDPENADLEELKGLRKLGLPFLLVLRGSMKLKNDVRERSRLRKSQRNNLFPTYPDSD
jgi:hypothetical protein